MESGLDTPLFMESGLDTPLFMPCKRCASQVCVFYLRAKGLGWVGTGCKRTE